jgi:TolB-like protein/Tfp pilus assembly protein PilF/tRNA A-37 threonylcarbamoyl transferase component Bud32
MSADPLRLDDLLDSVADGSPVDWEARAADADPTQQRLLNHLRIIAGVAEVHRTTGVNEASLTTTASPVAGRDGDRRIPTWGHMLLLDKVGEGAFGEVYRARDAWLDREVALKLMKPDAASRLPVTRLIAEARALARIRHPNVVTVHGADIHDGRVGLWMDFVHGSTLAEIVAGRGAFSGAEAAVIGEELCRAVAAVHAGGLVHRDIKAQNVMREPGGRVVLMDFGAGHTPLYLAPELLAGRDASAASDIYAVGVLLYFLVTTSFPVQGTSIEGILRAHARGERRSLSEARPDLADAFIAVVERALDPDPARRFGSAREMQDALAPMTTAAPVAEVPRARTPRTRSWTVAAAAVLLAIAGMVGYWRIVQSRAVAHASVDLIAVLPFQPFGNADKYLSEGITEALMQELSTAGPLQVISRTSVERMLADRTPLPRLAASLGADGIVEGSVFRSGDRVAVNVRIIRAGTDTSVWAKTFDRASADIGALQRDVARAIASELRVALYPATIDRWRNGSQVGADAYDAYLRGRYEARKTTQASTYAALEQYRRAISLEPRYARAYAAMAECFLKLGNDFSALPVADATREANDAVRRALELDNALPEAHAMLASVRFQTEWNFSGAEAEYRRAIELDGSLVDARAAYATFLATRGRFDEARTQAAFARQLDPLSASLANVTGLLLYYARDYERAAQELQRAIQLDPADVSGHVGLGRIYNAMGRHEDAIREYQRAAQSFPGHPYFESEIAQAEIALGRTAEAKRRIEALRAKATEPASQVNAVMMALVYAPLDKDEAFGWLAKAFETPSWQPLTLKVDPRFDPIRADPRFQGFLKRIQLEP